MEVQLHQLEEGDVLAADIISLSGNPIIRKGTVITNEHIEVLYAFLISKVHINGVKKGKEASEETFGRPSQLRLSFKEHYNNAIQEYKKLFANWQAGSQVDIYRVRNVMVPLLEKSVESSKEIISIHHMSKPSEYMYHHPIGVGLISALLGRKLSLPKGDWIQLGITGFLLDCGMAKISPNILTKEGSLTLDEFTEMKKHTVHGYQMLKDKSSLKDGVKLAILQHHEREDGSGYPLGTTGENLHPYSRLVSVADIFHAMTSERLYRKKHSPFKVIEEITEKQFGAFNPNVVNTLINELTNFSIGTRVRLSDQSIGSIVFIEPQTPTRPLVKLNNDTIISLKDERNLFIEEVLS